MIHLLLSFMISTIIALLVVRLQHFHGHITSDHDTSGIQKFHTHPVPRIGGVPIMLALVGVWSWQWFEKTLEAPIFGLFLLASLPAFLAGLLEDITKRVSSGVRLFFTMLAAGLAFYWLDAQLVRLDIAWLDALLESSLFLSLALTAFAVGGLSNAINLIDGYNGLAAGVSIFILFGIAYVGFIVNDPLIWQIAFALIGAIGGFLVWNYPAGLIFLGDGGAYLIGYVIAELSVLLIFRHPEVSAWFPLLAVFYPVFETLFTIYRRVFIAKTHPGMPDAAHLHQLIYKRVVRWAVGSKHPHHRLSRNSMTSPYLWILCSVSLIPAIFFWRNTLILQGFAIAFCFVYVWLYRRIVRFDSPRWMIIKQRAHKKNSVEHNNE